MKSVCITLPVSNKEIAVDLDRKKMKSFRLKVYPNHRVVLSLPRTVSTARAEAFLNEKSAWIEKKLAALPATPEYAVPVEIRDGVALKMFGEDMLISISPCEKESVYSESGIIRICCRDIDDSGRVTALFEKWWRKEAQAFFEERVRHWYPVIERHGIEMPRITVRKMRTLWGSCSISRRVVTFNYYLIKAPLPAIDYVVLHELVHFIHPNHSKQFYDFLAEYMPDWKERKHALKGIHCADYTRSHNA